MLGGGAAQRHVAPRWQAHVFWKGGRALLENSAEKYFSSYRRLRSGSLPLLPSRWRGVALNNALA